MNRMIFGLAGLAISASAANAAFLGLQIREDKPAIPASTLAVIDPGNLGVRSFNFYAKFDGAGTGSSGNGFINTVLSVGQPALGVGFGINKGMGNANLVRLPDGTIVEGPARPALKNRGAYFFQTDDSNYPSPAGIDYGSYRGPNSPDATNNFAKADTFLSIGMKQRPRIGTVGANFTANTTSPDPDAYLASREGLFDPVTGNPAQDFVAGGWFNSNPPNLQGAALANAGKFETFLGQITIIGLEAGTQLWNATAAGIPAPNSALTWIGDVFEGEMTINRQGGAGEPTAVGITIHFTKVPTPGAMALFGVAGLAGLRRRR